MSARHFASSLPEVSSSVEEDQTESLALDEAPVESVEAEQPNAYMPVEKKTHHRRHHHHHHSSSGPKEGEDDEAAAYMPVEKKTRHHRSSGHRSRSSRRRGSSRSALKNVKRVVIGLVAVLLIVVGAALG